MLPSVPHRTRARVLLGCASEPRRRTMPSQPVPDQRELGGKRERRTCVTRSILCLAAIVVSVTACGPSGGAVAQPTETRGYVSQAPPPVNSGHAEGTILVSGDRASGESAQGTPELTTTTSAAPGPSTTWLLPITTDTTTTAPAAQDPLITAIAATTTLPLEPPDPAGDT